MNFGQQVGRAKTNMGQVNSIDSLRAAEAHDFAFCRKRRSYCTTNISKQQNKMPVPDSSHNQLQTSRDLIFNLAKNKESTFLQLLPTNIKLAKLTDPAYLKRQIAQSKIDRYKLAFCKPKPTLEEKILQSLDP